MVYTVGDKIGRVKVTAFAGVDHANKMLVLCECECGKSFTTRQNNVGRKTNSCGCLKADLIRERMGKPIEDLATRHVLNSCKRKTPDTDLDFQSVKDMIFGKCYYCERSAEEAGKIWTRAIKDGRSIKKLGIDRVENHLGYWLNNSVACCKDCNYIKRDHSVEFLIPVLKKMLKNLKTTMKID